MPEPDMQVEQLGSIAAAICASIWVGCIPPSAPGRSGRAARFPPLRAPNGRASSRRRARNSRHRRSPGSPAHGRDRRPAVVFPLAGQGQMHAQIERRIGGCSVGYLAEPGAGRHDRAASDKAAFGERQKATVCSVTHPDVVDMKDGGAFDAQGTGKGHPSDITTPQERETCRTGLPSTPDSRR